MSGKKRGILQGCEREKMERDTGVGERNGDWRKKERDRQGWQRENERERERDMSGRKGREREGMGERTREKIERETGCEIER